MLAVIEQRTIWESIILVVTLDILHNDLEMIIVLLFHSGNKELEEIQPIVISTKAVNLAKQIVRTIEDLLIIAKKK